MPSRSVSTSSEVLAQVTLPGPGGRLGFSLSRPGRRGRARAQAVAAAAPGPAREVPLARARSRTVLTGRLPVAAAAAAAALPRRAAPEAAEVTRARAPRRAEVGLGLSCSRRAAWANGPGCQAPSSHRR